MLCVVVLGGLLAYDAKLKPYDDLVAKIDEVPDPEQNGSLYLTRGWENVPVVDWHDQTNAAKMTSRGLPWDDALALKIRTGRETVLDTLKHAAGLPHWVPSMLPEEGEGKYVTSPHSWMVRQSALIAVESCAAARAGDAEKAFEIWKDQHVAAVRQIEGCRDILTLLVGLGLQWESAALSCDLLEWLPNDTVLLTRLEEFWAAEPFTDEVAETALRGELHWLWAELARSGPLKESDYRQWPSAARLLLRKNITMNRYVGLVRVFGGKLMKPVPTPEDFPLLQLERAGKSANWMSPNYFGTRMVAEWARRTTRIFQFGLTARRFLPRAMRVRLALQRWMLAHGDTPPATLEEMVPEFLPRVPEDPWNGKPLGWDPATWMVFAVGYDWDAKEFPTDFKFGLSWRAWIDLSSEGPGLRAKLPPGAANVRP